MRASIFLSLNRTAQRLVPRGSPKVVLPVAGWSAGEVFHGPQLSQTASPKGNKHAKRKKQKWTETAPDCWVLLSSPLRSAPGKAAVPWVPLASLTWLQTRSEQERLRDPLDNRDGKDGCDAGTRGKADVSPSVRLGPNTECGAALGTPGSVSVCWGALWRVLCCNFSLPNHFPSSPDLLASPLVLLADFFACSEFWKHPPTPRAGLSSTLQRGQWFGGMRGLNLNVLQKFADSNKQFG